MFLFRKKFEENPFLAKVLEMLNLKQNVFLEEVLDISAEKLLKCQIENKLWEERRKREA